METHLDALTNVLEERAGQHRQEEFHVEDDEEYTKEPALDPHPRLTADSRSLPSPIDSATAARTRGWRSPRLVSYFHRWKRMFRMERGRDR